MYRHRLRTLFLGGGGLRVASTKGCRQQTLTRTTESGGFFHLPHFTSLSSHFLHCLDKTRGDQRTVRFTDRTQLLLDRPCDKGQEL